MSILAPKKHFKILAPFITKPMNRNVSCFKFKKFIYTFETFLDFDVEPLKDNTWKLTPPKAGKCANWTFGTTPIIVHEPKSGTMTQNGMIQLINSARDAWDLPEDAFVRK